MEAGDNGGVLAGGCALFPGSKPALCAPKDWRCTTKSEAKFLRDRRLCRDTCKHNPLDDKTRISCLPSPVISKRDKALA